MKSMNAIKIIEFVKRKMEYTYLCIEKGKFLVINF